MDTTGLLSLANELLIDISDHLDDISDALYKRDASDGRGAALHWAAKHGLTVTAELSLAAGAKIDGVFQVPTKQAGIPLILTYKPDVEATPLQMAIVHVHDDMAVWFIEHGAKLKVKLYPDSARFPLLHLASALGLTKTMQVLLKIGTNVNSRDGFEQTPLHHAVNPILYDRSSGSAETDMLLLMRGASVLAPDYRGYTPEECFHHQAGLPFGSWTTKPQKRQQNKPSLQVEDSEDPGAEKKIRELLEAKLASLAVAKLEKERAKKEAKRKAAEQAARDRALRSRATRAQACADDEVCEAATQMQILEVNEEPPKTTRAMKFMVSKAEKGRHELPAAGTKEQSWQTVKGRAKVSKLWSSGRSSVVRAPEALPLHYRAHYYQGIWTD